MTAPAGSSTWSRSPASPAPAAGWPGGVAEFIARVRPHTELPLLVGFGIAAPETARAALDAGADGVVIGSKAIEVAEEGGPAALERFVAGVAAASATG